jgi:2-aminophenol/2-amino-5-chlorophenol 1,6-dioxygenase alpha subunit
VSAYRAAGERLAASAPDVIAIYSTQWMAVLDELWQTRAHVVGEHVDENWHEYGVMPFDMNIDTELTAACVAGTRDFGIRSKGVDYDQFPVDSGTITATHFLNPEGRLPLVIAANNLYHDGAVTEKLAGTLRDQADAMGRKVALVGVGGLSGTIFRDEIDITTDHIASTEDDAENRRMLDLIAAGDAGAVRDAIPDYAKAGRVDMGFKHMSWLLGGLGGSYGSAEVLGYGPVWGTGAAVIAFQP